MRLTNWILAPLAALLVFAAGTARAEVIELANGLVMQGDIDMGRTSEEGLALNLYETGGLVIVKWSHIEPSRARQLRRDGGLEAPEESVELIDGHRVLTVSGEVLEGWSPNPRDAAPLKMKTKNGVKEYDRSSLAGKVEDARIDGLIVYTVEELYAKIRDENPPETSAAHKLLAQRCMNIGAYDHAKEHLSVCKGDAAFMDTPEGKAVDAMLRVTDVMIRAKGADDLKKQIQADMYDNRWHDAVQHLTKLDADYKDESIRKAIAYDNLAARVDKGFDDYFRREVAKSFLKWMDKLITAKAAERKPRVADPNAAAGAAGQGTLAAARQWSNRDLAKQIWDKVMADTGIKDTDALEKYWKQRTIKQTRKATYGTGSFIIVKRAAAKSAGGGAPAPRRLPSAQNKGGAPAPVKVDKPLSDEEWWDSVGPGDKEKWLTANFVETCGYFTDFLRTEQTNCQSCGGTGKVKSTGTDGGEDQSFCKQCNDLGLVKSVYYR